MNIRHFRLFENEADHPISNGGVTLAIEEHEGMYIMAFTRCSVRDRYSVRDPKIYKNLSKSICACKNIIDNKCELIKDDKFMFQKKHAYIFDHELEDDDFPLLAETIFYMQESLPPEEMRAINHVGIVELMETRKRKQEVT